MKTKMLKKLTAVLCAATMSMSIVSSTGAIYYPNNALLNNDERILIQNLNDTIANMGQSIIEMKQIVNSLNNISNKQNMLFLLDSIYSTLTSMHNEKLCCPNKTLIGDFNQNILPIKVNIHSTLTALKSGNISVDNFNNSIYNINTQLNNLYQNTITAINNINTMPMNNINNINSINTMPMNNMNNINNINSINTMPMNNMNNINSINIMPMNNINNNQISFDKITKELDQLIATATNNLKNKQQKEFGNDEKFLETMDKLTTDINAGIQTDFEINGTTQGNCWALTSQTLSNFGAHNYGIKSIVKNNNDDDILKAKKPNEFTTVEQNIDKILNNGVNNNQKINVKKGQDNKTIKKLLSKLNIKTLSFEIPEEFKKSFSSFELQQVCQKIEKYLLLEHFSHNNTPVIFLHNTFWPGQKNSAHATLIIGINTFHNPLEYQLIEHAGTIYKGKDDLEKDTNVRSVSVGFDQVEESAQYMEEQAEKGLDSTGLIFPAFLDKFSIETTKNCTWQDFKTTILKDVREKR